MSFLTEGETSNELVFLSGYVVVTNCDVPVAQITQAKKPPKLLLLIDNEMLVY